MNKKGIGVNFMLYLAGSYFNILTVVFPPGTLVVPNYTTPCLLKRYLLPQRDLLEILSI